MCKEKPNYFKFEAMNRAMTPKQMIDRYTKKFVSLIFFPPTDAQKRGGSWFLKVQCRLCGKTSWVRVRAYRQNKACSAQCSGHHHFYERDKGPHYNWDLAKFWPKTVTWDRSKEAYWRQ